MTRTLWIIAAILILTTALCAQPPTPPGAVHAVVQLIDGTPVAGAPVELAGNAPNQPHHMPRAFFAGLTGLDGVIDFVNVPEGPYTITTRFGRDHHEPMGMAAARLDVVSQETTNVTLTIQRHDSAFHPRDSLTVVELTGVVIIVTDSLRPNHIGYFLDVDVDGTPDYRLSFGPPWYSPDSSAAVRPSAGDEITITGGLLTYTNPPVVVVFTINGLFWRDPRHGHGGHGGGDHQNNGCNPDSITAIEVTGTAMVRTADGWHGERTCYAVDVNGDSTADYALDFGGPDYDPGTGAVRPAAGDAITIVGGEIYCPNAPLPIVIVYEINGLLWRVPGDTIGLGTASMSVGEPVYVGAPVSHLMARNYPNPFNPVTTISYSIPTAGQVELKVFDISGREVAALVNMNQSAGSYAVAWDGSTAASGIYFYRLSVGNLSYTSRMVLMK